MSQNPTHHALVAAVRHGSREMVRELGLLGMPALGMSRCHALTELALADHLTVAQLADRLRLDKSTASRVVSALQKEGLLETRPDPEDRRKKPLYLTEAGRATSAVMQKQADAQVQAALNCLSEAQRHTVIDGLGLYAKALHKARLKQAFEIRPIRPEDNLDVARIIRGTLTEYGANKPGFAFMDPELDCMFETYDKPRATFYVVTQNGRVVGGGGYSLLRGETDVCELQKMYFESETRGLGLGADILARCLEGMRRDGYKGCYLETLQHMERARRLYHAFGFRPLAGPMGATGHCGCDSYYYLDLTASAE